MLKVLIADDEELIRQLLKKLVEWDTLELELVDEASSGYEAFDKLVEYVPDIAIIDIRMPGFDGLSLARKAKELNLATRFILVSGYKEFEYAHEAMILGIQDYLLKPIRKNDINQTLLKVKNRILTENASREEHTKLSAQAKQSAEQLRFQFIKDITHNGGIRPLRKSNLIPLPGKTSLEELNDKYQLRFKEGKFQLFTFKESEHQHQECSVESCAPNLRQYFSTKLAPLCHDVVMGAFGHRMSCLINYDTAEETQAKINAVLKTSFEELTTKTAVGCNFRNATMGIGAPVLSVYELHTTVCGASDALDRRLINGAGAIYRQDKQAAENKSGIFISDAEERRFSELIDSGNAENMKRFMTMVMDRAFVDDSTVSKAVDLSYSLVDLFYKRTKNIPIMDIDESQKESIYLRIAFADSKTSLIACLCSVIDERFANTDFSNNIHVRFVKDYVAENYRSEIRLSDIADQCHINPSYLSRVFSEETDQTFGDYLTDFRIQVAKELLKNISVNVSEVAEMVGYNDIKYFSKIFKKTVGISPKDYRKLHAH